jgi:two-component system cell cycle sensor histidine kinase/response regulator CckA
VSNSHVSDSLPDFQSLFQCAPGSYLVLAPNFTIAAVSDSYLRATMTRREEIVGRGVFDIFPDNPDDPASTGVNNLRASLDRVLLRKSPDTMAIQKYDIRKPQWEGGGFEERFWSPVNYPVLNSAKELLYILHSVEDVTEIVRLKQQGIAKETLHQELGSEEKFYKAFNANPEPITLATIAEGRYIDVNERFCQVTGYRRAEVIGRTFLELKFWDSADDRAKMIEQVQQRGSVRDMEIVFQTKSGEKRNGLISCEPIDVAGQKCIITIFKDVSDQKLLEKQLRQAQKMEAIGQLSGGIAHDFNNLLSVIIGYADVLEERLPLGSPLHKECAQIKKAGQRAAALTGQLLAFSRQQVLAPSVLDLNLIVLSVEKMLRRVIGENIQIMTELAADLGSVKADQGQIEQVLMNLAVNARDAMPDGGRLMIQTGNFEVDEEYARRHAPLSPGPHVVIAVCDTGAGMDAEIQSHIFEPFFTTKEQGKGTGLGLSTVYGVVRQSGGHIWVYSEPGRGTTFKIYLPQTAEAAQLVTPNSHSSQSLRGTETILLVEDEDALRDLTRDLLVGSGYKVIDANHPEKAVEIASHYSGAIDLLLTDVVMPGMNGCALAAKLATEKPGMRVIYMSGYTGLTHPELLNADAPLLAKPFTREALLRKVRGALETSNTLTSD